MTNDQAYEMFERSGALLTGHFVLSSGLHSDRYLEKFRLVEDPALLEPLCQELAERCREVDAEVVMGPTTAGIILAYNVARILGLPARYAEMDGPRRELRRGQQLAEGTRVLVVDDILTTGGSIRECMDVIERKGARLVGVGVLGDRSAGKIDFGVPLAAALAVAVETYHPEECPLCAQGIAITKPGTRKL